MKNILLTILLAVIVSTILKAEGADEKIIWKTKIPQTQKLSFTPDDKYIIAWANEIQILNTLNGKIEFSIPTESTGDFNFNKKFLVYAIDSIPKLLNWQTKEIVEGFKKENENIGRIRTAKSKNEFMANTYHYDDKLDNVYSNIIYFYDVDSKRKVDSFDLGSSFEKDGYKWKRTIHEYDFVGKNDELIYVIIDDANDVLENIPPMFHKQHYFVNIYNRETKMLVDSTYSFTNTNEKFGGFNKMQVMNDRSKIAYNGIDGEINFVDVIQRKHEGTLDLAFTGEVEEMEFSDFDNKFYVSRPNPSKYLEVYDFENTSLVKQYVFLKHIIYNRVAFNSNNSLIAFNGIDSLGFGIIGLLDDAGLISNVENKEVGFVIKPNPSSNMINISYNFESFQNYKLLLYDFSGNQINIINEGGAQYIMFDYNISYLSSGTYFIRLEIGNKIITKQFIKE